MLAHCQDPGLLSCGSNSFGVNSTIAHVISGSTAIINANGGNIAPSGNPFTTILSEEILLKDCITLKFILESRIRQRIYQMSGMTENDVIFIYSNN